MGEARARAAASVDASTAPRAPAADVGRNGGVPDGYTVVHRCGEGTYGVVHLCRTRSGRLVAVKTIKEDGSKQARRLAPGATTFALRCLRSLGGGRSAGVGTL